MHVFVLFPSITLKHLDVQPSNRKTTITHNNFRHCRVSISSFVRCSSHPQSTHVFAAWVPPFPIGGERATCRGSASSTTFLETAVCSSHPQSTHVFAAWVPPFPIGGERATCRGSASSKRFLRILFIKRYNKTLNDWSRGKQ